MKITAIVACDTDHGIGLNGKLPWHIPEDLRMFREYTLGKPVVMGRKTFESLGNKPLPGRHNYVMSRDLDLELDGATVVHNHMVLRSELTILRVPELCVIGGSEIYELFAPFTNKLLMTIVDKKFETDTHFPIEAFCHLKFNGNMTSSAYETTEPGSRVLWRRLELDDKKPYVNT